MASILTIGGHSWVAGLRWKSYEEEPSNTEIIAEAEVIAQELSGGESAAMHTVYVKHTEESADGPVCDVGYGVVEDKPKGALYSIGAALAKIGVGSEKRWSATFEIAEGKYLFIAVSDGSVDPSEHGEVVGDEATVKSAAMEQAWKDFPHEEFSLAELERLLGSHAAADRIVFVADGDRAKTLRTVVAIAAVLVLAGVGIMWHIHDARELALLRREAFARAQAMMHKKQKKAPDPLLTSPSPAAFLAACRSAIAGIPIDRSGWAVQSIQCAPTGVTVIWHATPGAWLYGHPHGAMGMRGQHVVWHQAFTLPNGDNEHLPITNTVILLRELASQVGVPVEVTQQRIVLLPGQKPAKNKPKPLYQQVTFSLSSSWAPWSMPLSGIPGLRISEIDVNGLTWQVKGTVYGSAG